MKIAQTTSACGQLYGGKASLLDIAAYYAKVGYTAVDLSFLNVAPLRGDDWLEWAAEAKEFLQKNNIPAVQSHAPIFNAFSKDITDIEEKLEMVKRTLVTSGTIGIPWVVIHPNTDYCNNRFSVNLAKNKEYFKPLLELAAKYGTGIAIENLFDTYHRPLGVSGSSEKSDRRMDHHLIAQRRYGSNPEELLELVDALAQEFHNVGICWDFGHANESGLNHVETLELLGKRIKALHVNDNMAVFDDHLTPFCGTVPWKEVMPKLKEIGYEGSFTYENHKFVGHVPEELLDAALTYSLKVAKYLVGLFDVGILSYE